jgi:hypothetical protein
MVRWQLFVIGFLRGQPTNLGTQPALHHPRRNRVAPTKSGVNHSQGATNRGPVLLIMPQYAHGCSRAEWTVRGANAIVSLRCATLSQRFANYWKQRAA